MRKNVLKISGLIIFGAMAFNCTRNDNVSDPTSLKEAVNLGAAKLNTAMNEITSTKAYQILTVSDIASKSATVSDSVYKVNITLDRINGVYDYKPVTKTDRWGVPLVRFFTRTADNSKMIVNMPLSKVTHPRSLRQYFPSDTALVNNFSISVSDYHNNFSSFWNFDYLLSSEISIDKAIAGNLNIRSVVSPATGIHYASQYAFTGSYTANYKYESGDTTESGFSIRNADKILWEEKLLTVRNDTARFGREHKYILTIGDVQIIRKSGTGKIQVLLKGVVQANAVIQIVDKQQDSEASVCRKREVQITFDDGTSTTISSLISQSIDDIKTLFTSLHQVYFAANMVDWIAYDVYNQKN